jgi:hypothetical protein
MALALLYFGWMGAATQKEFRDFCLFPSKLVKAACDAANLVLFEDGSDLLCLPEAREQFTYHTVSSEPIYQLVGGIDSFLLQRRGCPFWVAAEDAAQMAPTERGLKRVGDFNELSSHAILDRGRLVGIWEYDRAQAQIVWAAWIKHDDALLAAISITETYVREELGDARTFSLDSPTGRGPKLDAIRVMRMDGAA